jgi:hypothetical protein
MLKVSEAVEVEPSEAFIVPDNEPSEPIIAVPLYHAGPGDAN